MIYLTAIFFTKDTVFSVALVGCIALIWILYSAFSNNVNGWGSLILMILLFLILAHILMDKIDLRALILLPLVIFTTISAIRNRMNHHRKSM